MYMHQKLLRVIAFISLSNYQLKVFCMPSIPRKKAMNKVVLQLLWHLDINVILWDLSILSKIMSINN